MDPDEAHPTPTARPFQPTLSTPLPVLPTLPKAHHVDRSRTHYHPKQKPSSPPTLRVPVNPLSPPTTSIHTTYLWHIDPVHSSILEAAHKKKTKLEHRA